MDVMRGQKMVLIHLHETIRASEHYGVRLGIMWFPAIMMFEGSNITLIQRFSNLSVHLNHIMGAVIAGSLPQFLIWGEA